MRTYGWFTLVASFAAVLSAPAAAAPAAKYTLKFAMLAPDGSAWMQSFDRMKAEVLQSTGGQVSLKAYPAGILGEEKDVLFKIRVGQVDGGGFLGYGVGAVCPEVRALMLPLMLRDYSEADAVLAGMEPYLSERALNNGFVVLGWTEIGFAYLYSTVPVRSLADLRAAKPWAIPGEEMISELFKAGRISAIPVPVGDVLTALQTSLIQTVYSPALAAVAMQWHTRVRYRNSLKVMYSLGGLFVARRSWEKLPPDLRDKILPIARRYTAELTQQVRKSDEEALAVMASDKIETVNSSPEAVAEYEDISRAAAAALVGKSVPKEAYDKAVRILADYRKARPAPGAAP